MINTIFDKKCQSFSSAKLFGLCDDPAPSLKPAYIDEHDDSKWLARVVNEELFQVIFSAIDHCIAFKRNDGRMEKRCDGVLVYNSNIIFVELKDRNISGSNWIKEAESQLLATINYFESKNEGSNFRKKMAYIANRAKPYFRRGQISRMEQFQKSTGYVLRIEHKIIL